MIFNICQYLKNLTVVYADLCRFYGMVSNKWYNEAKPILDYIVCPIGIKMKFTFTSCSWSGDQLRLFKSMLLADQQL